MNILIGNELSGIVGMVKYYAPNNQVDFKRVLEIPLNDRLPELAKKIGVKDMGKIIMAEIMKFQNCYNVIRPMNATQMAQCASSLILSAEEDYLSLEDIVLFFEGAKQGKYGKVYDRLDQQIIFEMLEQYRDERHKTFMDYKEEEHAQFKAMPVNERIVSDAINADKSKNREAISEYLRQQLKKTA